MNLVEKNLFHQMIQQMSIFHTHSSNVVQKQDLERAVQNSWFLQNLTILWNLDQKPTLIEQAKELVSSYPEYKFSSSALKFIQNFINIFHEKYPTKETLLSSMPLYKKEIEKIYAPPPTNSKESFEPQPAKINLESNLYHTTNAFEIFERKSPGTPLGTAWFNIDSIYPEHLITELYPDKGAMRVIRYRWIGNPWLENINRSYPFLDSDSLVKPPEPRILDARKLKQIPKNAIEDYMEQKGVAIYLPEPDLSQDILSQYGRNWRPFVIEYLKSMRWDGILTKDVEIGLFEPRHWISFLNIEAGDNMYMAIQEVLQEIQDYPEIYNKDMIERFLVPKIAGKYKLDPNSLQVIYNINSKNQ